MNLKEIISGKKIKDYSFLGADMHSHLLPAVDDGSKSISESIQFIKKLQSMGFSKLILTPHIYKEFYPNTKENLEERFQLLKNEVAEQNMAIDLHLAAEYYLDENFIKLLEKGELLTFGKKGLLVLVETSFVSLPAYFEEYLFEIIAAGYTPVLAHPERYLYMNDRFRFYHKINEMGVLMQLNINSLGGYYGKQVEELAIKLYENGLVDFMGTDLHHEKHEEFLQSMLGRKILQKVAKYDWLNKEI